jgi:DNA repair ATPase RecN
MKPEKPKKSVADMNVLKDLRELISTVQGAKPLKETQLLEEEKVDLEAKVAQYKAELERMEKEIERLRREKEEMATELNLLRSQKSEEVTPSDLELERLSREVSRLESQKSALSLAIGEAEELLKIKLGELLRRVAMACETSGLIDAGIQFRKMAHHLESSEELASFLRILLRGG